MPEIPVELQSEAEVRWHAEHASQAACGIRRDNALAADDLD